MAVRKLNEVVEVKDKAGNVLGTYIYTEVGKPDTYIVDCTNKAGNSFTVTKEITKADITALVTQAFNVNVRNYVAGLARPSKPSKLKAFEAYFTEKGIDVTGIDTDKLIAKLKEMA
jgi:ribosomal protein L23